MAGLHGISSWEGNPNPRKATFDIQLKLSDFLRKKGWCIQLRDLPTPRFTLETQTRREVLIELNPGQDFEAAEIATISDRDITTEVLIDGAAIRGMPYRLDHELSIPFNKPDKLPGSKRCLEQ